jgi:type IV pilus assembly protein PilB
MDGIGSIEDLIKQSNAKAAQATTDESVVGKFESKMAEVRLKEKEAEAQEQAQAMNVPYVNLKGFPISPEALLLVPKEQSESLKAIPFLFTGTELRMGAVNPKDQAVQDLLFQLTERNKANGAVYKISDESFRIAFKMYDTLPKIKPIIKGVKITDAELKKFQDAMMSYADIQKAIQDASITDVMTILMAAALKFGTSDVHVEAEQTKIAARYRIDGVLQEVATLPPESWKKVIARIKLISGLKINVTEVPQDGRFTIFLASGDTDVRVSTIPTAWGESVVMRILKPSAINVEFVQLGWRPLIEKRLTREIEKPHGMIITTGPTGSGKTTTLYAILRKLNAPDVKIITLEDPIEYKLEGINQSQIDHAKQYTFAGGLRSILRQDPDVVMVGEIRDLETAEVAINAALTGHLLLSTIHTNSASGALPRFISMGVKPFLLAPALNAIIGQRLIRRIHGDCKIEDTTIRAERMEEVKAQLSKISPASGEAVPDVNALKFFKGKGCEVCNGTGYKGRIGIYEIIIMDDAIRKSLSEKISEYEVKQLAIQQGMVTMTQDGLLKALEGITTVEEVFDATGGD